MPPLRILVVENEALLRQSVMDMLQDLGHEPVEAMNGSTAMRILGAKQPLDVMLIDIGLPDMDGRELAKSARAMRPDLHMVFTTGYVVTALRDMGADVMARYLPKPFRHHDLEMVLNGLVTPRQALSS